MSAKHAPIQVFYTYTTALYRTVVLCMASIESLLVLLLYIL